MTTDNKTLAVDVLAAKEAELAAYKHAYRSQIEELRTELDTCQKDAQRYRWLVSSSLVGPRSVFNDQWLSENGNPSDLSSAIDAAMGADA